MRPPAQTQENPLCLVNLFSNKIILHSMYRKKPPFHVHRVKEAVNLTADLLSPFKKYFWAVVPVSRHTLMYQGVC
jgi:hypothetical protein